MNRRAVRASFAVVASLSVSLAGHYQSPSEIKIEVMGEVGRPSPSTTLYSITGQGGNSIAYVTDAGVVLVDSKTRGSGRHLIEAIELVTDKPVTAIINTHAHEDHTGSNTEFPAGVQVIAHENTRVHMLKSGTARDSGAGFLPTRTFKDRLSLSFGQQRVDLYYFGPGHTDGDTVVVFPMLGVAHFGDLFPGKRLPSIDSASGGSAVAYAETLAKAVAAITGIEVIVTGHDVTFKALGYGGPAMRWKDFVEFADVNREFVAEVKAAIGAGKNVDEALASLTVTNRYKDYDFSNARSSVEAIYREAAR